MEEELQAREASIINRMDIVHHNASFKKQIDSEIVIPSCPLPTPSAPKTIDFPYGIPMNASKGQVGSSSLAAIVGTNAMIANPNILHPLPVSLKMLMIGLMMI